MVRRLLLLLLLAAAALAAEASANPDAVSAASAQLAREDRPFRIGLIELSDIQRVEFLTARTIEHLKAASPVPIEIQTFTSRELESAVREKRVDAFIASSGFYWRMIPYGARDIATIISPNRPDPNHSSAITFITASRNPVIRTLEDLRGARLSASYPTAFMGYRIGLAEIAAEGYDPDNFFSSVTFTQSPEIDAIAGKVLTGEADAAFVQSCWLETQPASVRNKFRVIAPREDPSYPCLHSTHTYPNVTVAVLQGAAPGAAREIARLLLNMPPDREGERWGLATDFQSVDRVYKLLKLEHYSYLREWSVKRWIDAHKHWIAAGLFCLALLIAHSFVVSMLVRRRTAELAKAVAEKEAARERLAVLNDRMERIRKANLVSQLSNMIAHELAQPVGAARSFCDGLKLLVENHMLSPEKLQKSLSGLDRGLTRIQRIVEKVRSYSKGRVNRDCRLWLADVVTTARDSLSRLVTEGVPIEMEIPSTIAVCGDQLETELLFNNLLGNAATAAKKSEKPFVRVTAASEGPRTEVVIENSGRVMTEEDFAQLTVPFISSSGTGLGLGVPISMSLAEACGGRLRFERRTEGGLRAIVTLRTG